MDEIDEKIIEALKKNSRSSYKEMARGTHISDVAVHKRIKKLKGIIRKFTILVDQKSVGKEITAILMIKCEIGKAPEIANRLSQVEDIREVYTTVGEYDIIAKIRTDNMDSLKEITEKELMDIKGLNEVRTSIVFESLKEDQSLIL
ncbi:MAG: Lrp/AsnC family transcriptional regulator [Candidatus Hydrothermarchaeales archaeon]